MSSSDLLYKALASTYGIAVMGGAKELRETRARLLASDVALADLLVLGPNADGLVFLAKKGKLVEVVNG